MSAACSQMVKEKKGVFVCVCDREREECEQCNEMLTPGNRGEGDMGVLINSNSSTSL